MKKNNILFLLLSLEVGGTEKHLLNLISNLNKKKFNPVICCLYNLGEIGELFLNNKEGISVYHNVMKSKWDISGLGKIRRILRNEKIDILYMMNSPITLFYGIICAKMVGVNACITRMTTTNPTHNPKTRKIANLLLSPFLSKVIAQAYSHEKYLIENEGFNPEKIYVIYNGVDLGLIDKARDNEIIRESLGIPLNCSVIGIVGRLAPEKCHNVFLHAARKIIKIHPSSLLLIVGDGKERQTLEELTSKLAIQSNVLFLGSRKDVIEVVSTFDMAVLTSNREAFSNVILEYMASSKPVVTTNVSGVAEQVMDKETGYIVPCENPDALADAILHLLNNKSISIKMGKTGRIKVEKEFTLQKMVGKYESLFTDLMK